MAPLRLIDVNTMQFADGNYLAEEEKQSKKVIPYAILSHRWLAEEDEVQFDDFKSLEAAGSKKGLVKIFQTCRLAKEQGLEFVWLDTCCINKGNPTELQESINSMYRWYQEAAVCYTYLKDTDATSPRSMEDDEWFTRGWTLQELIAPRRVEFYDNNWQPLGDKNYLKDRISAITKIDASGRRTGKTEDRAYSLLGLLGVNMPTLYGEGEKSFIRLQEEIIKTSDDHSIFAWKGVKDEYPGLLAESLDNFQNCGSVKCTYFRKGRSAFFMTNRGISITLNLMQWTLDTYLARIHCVDLADSHTKNAENGMTGLFLRRLDEDDHYARVKINGQELVHDLRAPLNWTEAKFNRYSREVPIFVRQAKLTGNQHTEERAFGFRLGDGLLEYNAKKEKMFRVAGSPKGLTWNEAEKTLTLQPGLPYLDVLAYLDISKQGKKIKEIKLCFDFDFNPILLLAESSATGAKDPPLLTHTGSDETYSEQERHRWLSFAERSPHDSHPQAWNTVSKQPVVSKNSIRSGLWQLRGDRIEGLDVSLGGTQIRVSIKKVTTEFGRKFWELSFENMPGSSLKKFFA
ncbi:uncharacterized protein PAC_07630 [Phialocephala subalpina]|uniref:Uncharacterized protein n=1 Tax=Phialocephala subalpina TaxID=576137 RepID=A0A1L7WY93_9HELO|nr:uncharacterized protein PAC_07630 [Phialocephala subalpina]